MTDSCDKTKAVTFPEASDQCFGDKFKYYANEYCIFEPDSVHMWNILIICLLVLYLLICLKFIFMARRKARLIVLPRPEKEWDQTYCSLSLLIVQLIPPFLVFYMFSICFILYMVLLGDNYVNTFLNPRMISCKIPPVYGSSNITSVIDILMQNLSAIVAFSILMA